MPHIALVSTFDALRSTKTCRRWWRRSSAMRRTGLDALLGRCGRGLVAVRPGRAAFDVELRRAHRRVPRVDAALRAADAAASIRRRSWTGTPTSTTWRTCIGRACRSCRRGSSSRATMPRAALQHFLAGAPESLSAGRSGGVRPVRDQAVDRRGLARHGPLPLQRGRSARWRTCRDWSTTNGAAHCCSPTSRASTRAGRDGPDLFRRRGQPRDPQGTVAAAGRGAGGRACSRRRTSARASRAPTSVRWRRRLTLRSRSPRRSTRAST